MLLLYNLHLNDKFYDSSQILYVQIVINILLTDFFFAKTLL